MENLGIVDFNGFVMPLFHDGKGGLFVYHSDQDYLELNAMIGELGMPSFTINDMYISSEDMSSFKYLRYLKERGLCGVKNFMFTVGLVYGISDIGYEGRFCYPLDHASEAVLDYQQWDGIEDPKGEWIKHKGYREYTNPKYLDINETEED